MSCLLAPGNVGANTDFQCQLSCADGHGAAGSNAAGLPSAGIFKPPYLIYNNGTQLDINTKVHAFPQYPYQDQWHYHEQLPLTEPLLNVPEQTLPASARHSDGSLEYDVHNLYGLYMAIATTEAIKTIRQKRPFTLTRCAYFASCGIALLCPGMVRFYWLLQLVGKCSLLMKSAIHAGQHLSALAHMQHIGLATLPARGMT